MNILKSTVIAAAAVLALAGAAVAETNYGQIINGYNSRAAANDVTMQQDEYDARAGRTGYWIVGAGAAVNSLPLSASEFTLPLLYVAYESINKKSIGDLDFSWSFGLYDLMPELEFGVFIPAKPFDFRVSAGIYYDLIIGGSGGLLVKTGVIMNKTVQFDIFMIPIADQPKVSYANSLRQQKIVLREAGETALEFPVFGILLSLRI